MPAAITLWNDDDPVTTSQNGDAVAIRPGTSRLVLSLRVTEVTGSYPEDPEVTPIPALAVAVQHGQTADPDHPSWATLAAFRTRAIGPLGGLPTGRETRQFYPTLPFARIAITVTGTGSFLFSVDGRTMSRVLAHKASAAEGGYVRVFKRYADKDVHVFLKDPINGNLQLEATGTAKLDANGGPAVCWWQGVYQ